jgi:hypothetical protein
MSDSQKPQELEVYKPGTTALGTVPQVQMAAEQTAIVLAAREKALVEARYVVALRMPRDIDVVRLALEKECKRPSFAKAARYHKPIGKGIEGPSIRFAEAAIQAMGNVTVDTPTITEDAEKRVMRVTVTDIERNASYSQDVVVRKAVERRKTRDGDAVIRSRTNSSGQTVYLIEATDDEILNQQNALISKAIRTLGLRLVPGWLIDECMALVKRTLADEDAKDPDLARRKLFDAFDSVGVSPEQVKEWLGTDGQKLTPKERETLLGIYNALRDGEITWREVMDARASSGAASDAPGKKPDLKDAISGKASPPPSASPATPSPGSAPSAGSGEPKKA